MYSFAAPSSGSDGDLAAAFGVFDGDAARDLGDTRDALRLARLEELDHARQTVRDVGAGDAAGVEGAHGELRAGLADGLRRHVPDGVADLGGHVVGEGVAVALLADARTRHRT